MTANLKHLFTKILNVYQVLMKYMKSLKPRSKIVKNELF